MNEAEVRNQLKDWLLEHSQAPMEKDALTDDLPILEVGLLNSLDIVEFVLYIEELREEEVDTDEIEPEVFTSINTLWAGFFATLAA
ncbi:MAG: hypothetical protein AB8H86_27035 [Polyangiales bacterium]